MPYNPLQFCHNAKIQLFSVFHPSNFPSFPHTSSIIPKKQYWASKANLPVTLLDKVETLQNEFIRSHIAR